jgi:hypothetical protein
MTRLGDSFEKQQQIPFGDDNKKDYPWGEERQSCESVDAGVLPRVFSGSTVSLEAGSGFFAQDGAEDYGDKETEDEDAGDHEPLEALEEHIELDP